MSSLAAESPVSAVTAFDDDAWEDLLNFIEEKQVIPIIGPELVVVQTDAGPENLYTWIARSLAARLALDPTTLPARPTLDDVVTRHLANRGRREDLYTRIRSIMREATFAPPVALAKLAEITDFNLYFRRPSTRCWRTRSTWFVSAASIARMWRRIRRASWWTCQRSANCSRGHSSISCLAG